MPLIDSHAHLHGHEYDADRDAVLARARDAGLAAIITAGTDPGSSAAAIDLAEREPCVWATAGIHPHDAAEAGPDALATLRDLAASPRVCAIGEIGLDFYRDLSPRDVQRRLFAAQLDLAAELDLPAVIHSRDADAATIEILAPWAAARRAAGASEPFGVMHCYAYGPDRLDAYLTLGLFISVPGTVTYPKATLVQDAAARAPAGSLVLETDCPYLTPQSRRGRRNEPALVAETATAVADLRGITLATLAEQTTANARHLYRLPFLALGPHRITDPRPAGTEPETCPRGPQSSARASSVRPQAFTGRQGCRRFQDVAPRGPRSAVRSPFWSPQSSALRPSSQGRASC